MPVLVASIFLEISDLFAAHLTIAASCVNRVDVPIYLPLTADEHNDLEHDSSIKITYVDEREEYQDLILF